MSTLQKRFARSVDDLRALSVGESAWFWVAISPEMPFFVVVPQAADPAGERLVSRATWAASQQSPHFTARGVVRRLPSGLLTLTTTATLDAVSAAYAALCQHAGMPDLLVMQLTGEAVGATRLLQDLSALEASVAALAVGETRWFSVAEQTTPDRVQLSTTRPAGGLRGQLRRTADGAFRLRIDADQARPLGLALQQWGRQVTHWPTLHALSCATVTLRSPRARKSA